MINSFIVSLYNNATQPVNPSSEAGNVLWPDTYKVRIYSSQEQRVNSLLFGAYDADFNKFLASIQFLWLVENSVLKDTILHDDPRITYDSVQLSWQFADISLAMYDRRQCDRALRNLKEMNAERILKGNNLTTYRSALSASDRLAAVVAHFGNIQT